MIVFVDLDETLIHTIVLEPSNAAAVQSLANDGYFVQPFIKPHLTKLRPFAHEFLRGGPNTCSGPNEPGKCECIHAEANALTKPRSQEPFVAFITGEPCLNCAKLLINSLHCKEVYVVQGGYRTQDGVNLLKERLPVTILKP